MDFGYFLTVLANHRQTTQINKSTKNTKPASCLTKKKKNALQLCVFRVFTQDIPIKPTPQPYNKQNQKLKGHIMKCLSTTLIKTTIGATISTVILSSSLALAQSSTSAASQTEAQEKDLQILQLQKEIEALKMQNTNKTSADRTSADEQTDKQTTKNLTKAQKYAQKQEKKQAKIQAKQTRRNLSKNNFFLGLEVGGLQSQMQEKVDGTQNPTKKLAGLITGLC